MRHLVVWIAVLVVGGCSADGTSGGNGADPCTDAEAGQTRCQGTVLESCSHNRWVVAFDCGANNDVCVAVSDTTAGCSLSLPCTDGDEWCDGSVRKRCQSMIWEPVANCADTFEACHRDGATTSCGPLGSDCTAEETGHERCHTTTVETCDGAAWVAETDCAALSQACAQVEDTAACTTTLPSWCTSEQTGRSRCNGTVWQTCDGNSWGVTKDCASTGDLCRPLVGNSTQVECYSAADGEFEPCVGSGQGSCEEGLTCLNLETELSIPGLSLCVTDCLESASVCTGGRVCDPWFYWCVNQSGVFGDRCGLNGVGCGTLDCEQSAAAVDAFTCSTSCDWADVDTGLATCPVLQTKAGYLPTECLAGPYVELQQGASGPVPCTNPGGVDSACLHADGFACVDTLYGDSTSPYCVRPFGSCGFAVPGLASFAEATLFWMGNECTAPESLCKPSGSARASCAASAFVTPETQLSGDQPVSCTTDAGCAVGFVCRDAGGVNQCLRGCTSSNDCSFVEGFSCQTLHGEKICTAENAFCVDFCDHGETCGEGRTCIQPTVDCAPGDTTCLATGNSSFFPWPIVQENGSGSSVSCPHGNGDCDGAHGFKCYDLTSQGAGTFCGKPHRVCAGVVPEFGPCVGLGQGSCGYGLTCLDLEAAFGIPSVSMCETDCYDDAGICTGGRVCDPDFAWCVDPTGAFGDTCGLNGVGCGSSSCEQFTRFADAFACTTSCSYAAINTGVAGCPAASVGGVPLTTECLAGPFVDVQLNGSTRVTCPQPGVGTGCDAANGYTCAELEAADGSATPTCTRAAPRCGFPVDATPSYAEASLFQPLNDCSFPGFLCKPAGTADAVCIMSGFLSIELQYAADQPVTCTSAANCNVDYACLSFGATSYCARTCGTNDDCVFAEGFTCEGLGDGKYCAYLSTYCIDLCDQGESCGAGRTCTRVTVDCDGNTSCETSGNSSFFPFPELQMDATGHKVSCATDTTCLNYGTADGFRCFDFASFGDGKYCARAHKVCVGP